MGAIALVAGPLASAPVTTRSSHGTTALEIDVVAVDGVTLKATVYPGRPKAPGILLLPICNTVGARCEAATARLSTPLDAGVLRDAHGRLAAKGPAVRRFGKRHEELASRGTGAYELEISAMDVGDP